MIDLLKVGEANALPRAHPASQVCGGAHSLDWHGCIDTRYHPQTCNPRHTDDCLRPCESCHLTSEQREAAAWIAND